VKALSYSIKFEGMKDADAIAAVKKTLEALADVAEVKIDEENTTATVTMNAGMALTEEAVKAAFKDTSYSIKSFAKA